MFLNKLKKFSIIIVSVVIATCVIVAALFGINWIMQGKLPPGTFISGINLSNKTPASAIKVLNIEKTKFLKSQITLTLNSQTFSFTPEELGINILTEESVNSIITYNKEYPSPLEMITFGRQKLNMPLIVSIEDKKLLAKIDEKFDIRSINTKNAEYYFDEEGDLVVQDEVQGFSLNEEKLRTELKNYSSQLKTGKISLELLEQKPLITADKLEEKQADVLAILKKKITFIDPIYSDDWTIKLIDYKDWIKFSYLTDSENNLKVAIALNQDKFNEFIDKEISKWLDLPAENVNIYRDKDETITIEGRGNDGKQIERKLFKEKAEVMIANNRDNIVIPVKQIEPTITVSKDLEELGIKERIAVGHTSYYGSHTGRVHNIKVGSSKFNGKLIAPGEEFSFNKNLGPVDGSTGYKKELVIKATGTIPEYGGGICQVSTTMYRTALFAGLPITLRSPHSYAVSYYSQILGHGLDATIYLGGPDLKFINDTGKSILVQTYTQNDYELYIVFYGTSDGRSVEMEGPYLSNYRSPGKTIIQETNTLPAGTRKQVENNHTGFTALWYRYITDSSGKVTKETLNTVYRAIPAKILVGASAGPSI